MEGKQREKTETQSTNSIRLPKITFWKLFQRKPKNKTTMRQVEKASDKKKTPQDVEEEEEEDKNAMEKQ